MSSTPFGDLLKREREMREVSLEEICTATRINTRYLEALENERWSELPGGVFNRGFIRSVARYLGLDEDSLVAEYELHTKGEQAPHVTAFPPQEPNRRPWIAIGLAVVLVAALVAGWFAFAHYRRRIEAPFHKRYTDSLALTQLPKKYSEIVVPNPGTGPAGVRLADPLELKVTADKPAEVTVIADGQTVFDSHLEAGDSKGFSAQENLVVSSSDAGALLLEFEGQTVPPFGPPGKPGSVTLTRNDRKPSAGDSH
jgi:cytoskeletal protein RodZ